jgi:regulatory protein YycH of two-component signal transduction system YycFG
MKITLKTVILAALIVFNLVIIFSNFTSYEGLENNREKKEEKTPEELEEPTEPTTADLKQGIVGEGDMASS